LQNQYRIKYSQIIIYTQRVKSVFFKLFCRAKSLGLFRLLAKPHAVTDSLFNYKWTNIIFLNLVMHKKHQLIVVYVCKTAIVA